MYPPVSHPQAFSEKWAYENQATGSIRYAANGTLCAAQTQLGSLKERDTSEIDREMNSLHAALDMLHCIVEELRGRLSPVSAAVAVSASQAGMPAQSCEPSTSSQVAGGIQGARHRVHRLNDSLREAVDLLRC